MLTIILPGFGQNDAAYVSVGYCDGEETGSGDISSSSAKCVSAAVDIKPEMIRLLAGNSVESLRFYLPSKAGINTLKVWVRSTLDGENLAENTVKAKNLTIGWNEVELDAPYAIAGDEPFVIGYDVDQKSRSYAIGCAGTYREGGLYYRFDDGEWLTGEEYGNLCLEALVKGDNLPLYDLELKSAYMEPIYYDGDNLIVDARVYNRAVRTVSGFTASYDIEGLAQGESHVATEIAPGKWADVRVVFAPADIPFGEGMNLTFTLSGIDGGEDQDIDNNTLSLVFTSADKALRRVVLLEEFTTEMCMNCPLAASIIAEATSRYKEKYPGCVATICHHSGFNTDYFTSPFDEEYLVLYGGGTYAPAMMIDRLSPDGKAPVQHVPSADELLVKLEEARTRQTGVMIWSDNVFDKETSMVTVNVSASVADEVAGLPLRVSVVVVENDIPHLVQASAPAGYMHQHVMRTANSTWGDEIEWEGNEFSYSCSLEIADAWNKDNLEIVTYVNAYDPDDINNCMVYNANTQKLAVENSIRMAETSFDLRYENGEFVVSAPFAVENVWRTDGMAVSGSLAPGLYIVRLTDGHRFITRKFVVR